jgi:hypothetical protein
MKERLANCQLKQAEAYGGTDDPVEFRPEKLPTYCDKGDHRERSIYHSPQHLEHWKKVNGGEQ